MTEIQNLADLKTAYMHIYDCFATIPQDLVDATDKRINLRYARELFGVLTNAVDNARTPHNAEVGEYPLVVLSEGGEGDVWQPYVSHDDESRRDAEARFDAWAKSGAVVEADPTPAPATKEITFQACRCGCGENVPSTSNYKPGHDARHAGNVGREIAANQATQGFDRREVLAALPSDALKAKAEGIAEKAIEKTNAKIAKAAAKVEAKMNKQIAEANAKNEPTDRHEPATEEGIIKVGKNEFAATRMIETGEVVYFDKDKTLQASKTAAKTFTVD